MLQNLDKSHKITHTFLNVQCCPSNTWPQESTNAISKSSMDLYSTKEKPMWQLPLAGVIWPMYLKPFHWWGCLRSHTVKNSQSKTCCALKTNGSKLSCFSSSTSNGMMNYRLVPKQSDSKKWPIHTGHERGQLFIFLASKENKIHKTISIIHMWALQKQLAVVRDGEKYHICAYSVDAATQKSVPAVLDKNEEARAIERAGLTVLREMASTHSM